MVTRIAVAGATGRIGRMVIKALRHQGDMLLSSALVRPGSQVIGKSATAFLDWNTDVVLDDDIDRVIASSDCLIDVSTPNSVAEHIRACQRHGVRVVVAVTGLSEQTQAAVESAAKTVAIVQSANLSYAMTAVTECLAKAATMVQDFDVHIEEAHNRNKKDAPSGTALWMAEAVRKALRDSGREYEKEISFASIRGGNIVSEHTAMLIGELERIEIRHICTDREVYATGSLRAARFVIERGPGLYNMRDVVDAGM